MVDDGLSSEEANKAITSEIRRVAEAYRFRIKFCSKLSAALDFCSNLEGALIISCLVLLTIAEIILSISTLQRLIGLLLSLALVLPYLWANLTLSWKVRHAEQIRPFAQITEALAVLESGHRGSGVQVEDSLWDGPSSDCVSVLRDGVWRRLPRSLIAKGDVFRLEAFEMLPVDAVEIIDGDFESRELLLFRSTFRPSRRTSSFGTFKARSFACVPVFERFLESSVSRRSPDPWTHSRRRKTIFFEAFRIVRKKLALYLFVGLSLSLISSSIWTLVTLIHQKELPTPPDFQTHILIDYFLNLVFLPLCFMPLVHRVLIELTDVWGNARLQSLIQWLQETRQNHPVARGASNTRTQSQLFPASINPSGEVIPPIPLSQYIENTQSARESFSFFTSPSSSETHSVASSVASDMSVSRLPFKHQLSEVFMVLGQGLDGSSNLLQALNSTTSLVFVDKEGLLTDNQRTVQEICVVETKPLTKQKSQIPAICSIISPTPGTQLPPQPPEKDSSPSSSSSSSSSASAASSSSSGTSRERDAPGNAACVIVDILPRPSGPEGQRLAVSTKSQKKMAFALCPLATLMSAAKLPTLTDKESLKKTTIVLQDLLQSPAVFPSAFRECVCSLRQVCAATVAPVPPNISATAGGSFKIEKFILVLHSRTVDGVKPLQGQPEVMLAVWLLQSSTGYQLVTKGHPTHVVKRCRFYFDGEKIVRMSFSVRRSLSEIVTQWKGDGLQSLAFGYRPVDSTDLLKIFEKLNKNSAFVVDTTAASNLDKPWTQMPLGESPSEMLSLKESVSIKRAINKQIFLGMVALKLSTPQDLATRIASFHEAGIRFVYMSREGRKMTKTVGGLLGLETEWNSLISLKKSETSSGIRNVLGNVVLPSGIEDIKNHLNNVDNVPLQVSLFSDGTPDSILQMIKLLQSNGEVVTCVGSARRDANFELFNQADCSISVAVQKTPVCRRCGGRRCIGFVNRHHFPKSFGSTSAEHNFGAALNSLFCSLQIHMDHPEGGRELDWLEQFHPVKSPSDPLWLSELLYETFKESRRIVNSIQQAIVFFAGASAGFIAPMVLMSSLTYAPPCFRDISLMAILLVFLPIVSATLLYTPARETIMKELPTRFSEANKHLQELNKWAFWSYTMRFCPSSIVCLFLILLYFGHSLQQTAINVLNQTPDPLVKEMIQQNCNNNIKWKFVGGLWLRCLASLSTNKTAFKGYPEPLQDTRVLSQILILLFIFIMSLFFVDSLLVVPPSRNVWLLLAWLFIFVVLSVGVIAEVLLFDRWGSFVAPPALFWVILVVWSALSFLVDELLKRRLRSKCKHQQQYLKLLFATRLGMWSPK